MRKIITLLTPLFLLATVSAKAQIGMGLSVAHHMIDGDGTETTRQSSQENTGTHDVDITVPELFIEAIADNGWTIGLSYIPTRDMGEKSRSDTNSAGDTGTYTAKAEFKNVAQLYTDIPVIGGNYPIHVKLGYQHVTIKTLESLNSGSAYPDADVYGTTVGIGTKGDLPFGNSYYKLEATYTDFDSISLLSDANNKLEADLDASAVKLSVGYKF